MCSTDMRVVSIFASNAEQESAYCTFPKMSQNYSFRQLQMNFLSTFQKGCKKQNDEMLCSSTLESEGTFVPPSSNSSMDSEARRAWRVGAALLVSSNYSTVCTINKTLECISWIGNGISNFLDYQQRLGEYPPGTNTIICTYSPPQKPPMPQIELEF